MPYIIAVLAFIVIGVGFTLFQSNPNSDTEPISLNTLVEEMKETTSGTTTPIEENSNETAPIEINKAQPEPAKDTPKSTAPTETAPTTPTPSAPAPASTYTDGSYRTSSTYRTPEGTYTMDVQLTVSDDVITAASVGFDSKGARDGYSKRFNNSYQSVIVGKSLDTANLSRVGGASLTTRAFNNALDSIRSQAS